MMDRISEFLTMFMVGLGNWLSRLNSDEKSMITLLLAFLLIAATVTRVMQFAGPWH